MSRPIKNTIRKPIYITPEMNQELSKEAEKKCTNVSNLIRMIIAEYIERIKEQENE